MTDAATEPATSTHRPTLTGLPPGQREIDFFPRFGRDTGHPPPSAGDHPTVTFGGALTTPIELSIAELTAEQRHSIEADFHCVAGWSVTGLRWEGVRFADVFERVIVPAVDPATTITHVDIRGLDGEHFVAEIGDLLDDDVLLADRLDGEPLDGNHGAPLRLVSPRQYGYANIKHVSRIDALAGAPSPRREPLVDRLLQSHPRARVWEEERHGSVPSWLIRPIYRVIKVAMLASARRRLPR